MQSENDDVYKSQMNFFSKDIVSAVICYCDIESTDIVSAWNWQRYDFTRKEYKPPSHPFPKLTERYTRESGLKCKWTHETGIFPFFQIFQKIGKTSANYTQLISDIYIFFK